MEETVFYFQEEDLRSGSNYNVFLAMGIPTNEGAICLPANNIATNWARFFLGVQDLALNLLQCIICNLIFGLLLLQRNI